MSSRLPCRVLRALALAALATTSITARADGFNARLFRPSGDASGIGTLDGARAPDAGVIGGAIVSDASLAPVILYRGADHRDIVSSRLVLEPQLALGAGAGFGLYARAPFVVSDAGEGASGQRLSRAGVISPSLGILVPVTRQPLNDGRIAIRAEVSAPIGSQEQFRSDGAFTARFAAIYSGYIGPVDLLTSAGAQVAPVRGVGDAQLGGAVTGGIAARFLPRRKITGIASLEGRFDWSHVDQTSAFCGVGVEAHLHASQLRFLVGAGIHDVIGTPRAMFSLAWIFDPSTGSPPAPTYTPEAMPRPSTTAATSTAPAKDDHATL